MGIAYRCDDANGISVSVWAGPVTIDDAMRHVAKLTNDAGWGATRRILTDLRSMDPARRPTRTQVSQLASAFESQMSGRTRHAKWAVVSSTSVGHALQFAEQLGDDGRRLLVFNDLVSACIWLGLDVDATNNMVEALRGEALALQNA